MKLHLFALFLLLVNISFCQVKYEERQAHHEKTFDEYNGVIPLGEKGVVMVGKAEESTKGNNTYEFIFHDAQLQIVKQNSIYINKKFKLRSTCRRGDDAFLLFTNKDEYSFLHITPSFTISKIDGQFLDGASPENCYVMNSTAYFIDKNMLIMLDITTKKSSITHFKAELFDTKYLLITKFQLFPESNECMAFFSTSPSGWVNHALRLNNAGEILSTYNIREALGLDAVAISAANAEGKDFVFGGTYAKSSNSDPEGYFFLSVKDEQIASKKMINFLDVDSLNNTFYKLCYYNGRMVERRYNRQLRAKESNEEYAYPMKSATHDLIKIDNKFLLVNDLFEVNYVENHKTGAYKKWGVINFATMALLFDADAELIWDTSFGFIGSFLTNKVKLMSQAIIHDDYIIMAETDPTNICFATLNLTDGKIVKNTFQEKPLVSETLEHYGNYLFLGHWSFIDHWIDNTWLMHGKERVREKKKIVGSWDEYVIHKVKYDYVE